LGGFVIIFLPFYLTRARGYSTAQAGLIASLWGAGAIGAGPLGGFLADRFGRRATMLFSTVTGAAMMIALGLARTPLEIAACVPVLGLLSDLYRPAVGAAIADVVPAADRTRAYGYLYWAINLGVAAASVTAGLVADLGWWLLFACDAGTTLVFGALVLAGVPETRPASIERRGRATEPYRDRPFLTFVAIQLLVAIVYWQCNVTLALDMEQPGITPKQFGAIVALNGVGIVVLQPFFVGVAGRYRRHRLLALSALLTGVGFGINAFVGGAAVYTAGLALWTIGVIGWSSVGPSIVADLSPPELRGSYQGAYQLAWGIAGCVGPPAGTLVLARLGPTALWGGCAAVGTLAAALHLLDSRRGDRGRAQEVHPGAGADRAGSRPPGVGER